GIHALLALPNSGLVGPVPATLADRLPDRLCPSQRTAPKLADLPALADEQGTIPRLGRPHRPTSQPLLTRQTPITPTKSPCAANQTATLPKRVRRLFTAWDKSNPAKDFRDPAKSPLLRMEADSLTLVRKC